MINRIKKLIENISEEYFSTVNNYNEKVDIYKNSDSTEISKLLKQFKVLRFTQDYEGNFYFWDAEAVIHETVEEELFNTTIESGFKGRMTNRELLIYDEFSYDYVGLDINDEINDMTPEEQEDYDNYEYVYKEEQTILSEFKNTRLGNIADKLGIVAKVVRWI